MMEHLVGNPAVASGLVGLTGVVPPVSSPQPNLTSDLITCLHHMIHKASRIQQHQLSDAEKLVALLLSGQAPAQRNEPSVEQNLAMLMTQGRSFTAETRAAMSGPAVSMIQVQVPPTLNAVPQPVAKKPRVAKKEPPTTSRRNAKKARSVLKYSLTNSEKKASFPMPSVGSSKGSNEIRLPSLKTFKNSWQLMERVKIADPELKKAFMADFFSRKLASHGSSDRLFRRVHGLPPSTVAFNVTRSLPKKKGCTK